MCLHGRFRALWDLTPALPSQYSCDTAPAAPAPPRLPLPRVLHLELDHEMLLQDPEDTLSLSGAQGMAGFEGKSSILRNSTNARIPHARGRQSQGEEVSK